MTIRPRLPILPRLCFVSYRHIRELAVPVMAEYAHRARIEVIDATFHHAVAVAQDRWRRGQVDAIVSAGSNASILRAGVSIPVATIQLTGFDILQALIKARRSSDRVGLVMYGETIPELESIKDLLNIEIAQYAYQTPDDARQKFEQLREGGFRVIVGSSLVVELAEEAGLHGILAYSLSSIRRGFEDAIELARVTRLEAGRYEQLNSVLGNLQEAVLAVDGDHRIIAVNPPMERLLKRRQPDLLGQFLEEIEPQLSLQSTLETGTQERAAVRQFAQSDWIMHRTPIRERGEIVGAALTLYDARVIHEADTSLRIQQRRRQSTARHSFTSMVGESPCFLKAIASARRFARTDLTVLISGESGVGKELFAQAIHNESDRAGQPFVAVNCAAFPETLLESELFGYEEGAFTGARRGGKPGLFEAAHSGTVFLDEIGDMPLSLQTRLLRVLQEREVLRVGSAMPIPVDLRVIAATHQPLADMVAEGRFRKDLYFRINTLRLGLPTLRERPDDVLPMAENRVRLCLARLHRPAGTGPLLAPIRERLQGYAWPGNVRELENMCERLAVYLSQFEPGAAVDWSGLPEECPELFESAPAPALAAPAVMLDADRADRARQVLAQHFGNHQAAAQAMGISRSTLWRWLKPPAA